MRLNRWRSRCRRVHGDERCGRKKRTVRYNVNSQNNPLSQPTSTVPQAPGLFQTSPPSSLSPSFIHFITRTHNQPLIPTQSRFLDLLVILAYKSEAH